MSLSTGDLNRLLETHHVPGISFAVLRNFSLEYVQCAGYADASEKTPLWTDTIFQGASISKTMTALVVMKLYEAGKLDIDKPINTYLKSWKLPENKWTKETPVTVRQILAHYSGMNVPTYAGYIEGDELPSLIDVLEGTHPAHSLPVEVETAVNEQFIYSTGSFAVLQLILEELTNQDFETLMQKELFVPLQMHRTTFQQPLPDFLRGNAASGHRTDGQPVAGKYFIYPELAGSAIWTTPNDLAKVALHLQTILATNKPGILKPETLKTMLTPYQQDSFGLGYALYGDKGPGLFFGHNGNTEGFRSMFVAHASEGRGAFILVNSDNADSVIKEVVNRIAQTEGWEGFHW